MPDVDLVEQAERVALMLAQINRRLSGLGDADPTMELPMAQFKVCMTLREGPRTVSNLARELRATPSAITQIADRLQRAGLVERETDECDRRVRVLALTPAGEAIIRARVANRAARIADALGSVSPDEREKIIRAIASLMEAVRSSAAARHAEDGTH